MFVVGGSASWAQEKEVVFDFLTSDGISQIEIGTWGTILAGQNYECKENQEFKLDNVWLCGNGVGTCSGGGAYNRFYLYDGASFSITSKDADWLISKVDIIAKNSYFNISAPSGGAVGADNNWTSHAKWPATWSNYEFEWTDGVSPVESLSFSNTQGYCYIGKIIVTLAYCGTVEDVNWTVNVAADSPTGAGVVYNGTTYNDGATFSAPNNLNAKNFEAASVNGYIGTISVLGNTISVSYEQIPSDFVIITNANESSYSSYGVTVSSTLTWSSCLEIWASHSTLTVESAYFDIERIEFDEYQSSDMSLSSSVPGTFANNVWSTTTPARNIVFSTVSGDYRIKSMHIYAAQPPVEYTVHIVDAPSAATISVEGITGTFGDNDHFEGPRSLTKDAVTATDIDGYKYAVNVEGTEVTVTYTELPKVGDVITFDLTQASPLSDNGVTATYVQNNAKTSAVLSFPGGTPLVITSEDANILSVELQGTGLNYITASPSGLANGTWEGYEKSVSFTGNNYSNSAFITQAIVTLESVGEKTYTVVFDPSDIGGSITIGGNTFTPAENSVTVGKNLNLGHVESVVDPDDYYHDDVTFSGNTFYVNYHEYTKYSVVIANDSEYKGGEAGVVVSGASYGNGEYGVGDNVIKSKGALQQSNFAAKEVVRYDGVATLEGYTVTVKYTTKDIPPFDIDKANPVSGYCSASISSFILNLPQGKKLSETNNGIVFDLTVVNNETEAVIPMKAKYVYGYETYGQIKLQMEYAGGVMSDYTFTEPGTYVITVPAGIMVTTDGSLNNAYSVVYTVVAPAQMTSQTPSNGTSITNHTLIGQNFTMNFDKNISGVELGNVSVTFPDTKVIGYRGSVVKTEQEAAYYGRPITPLDEYPFGYNDGRDALRVTYVDNKIIFTPTAEFWQHYKKHLKTNGYIRFTIDAEGITDVNNVKNTTQVQIYYSYSYVAPESAVESSVPEVGTYSLDDREDGLGNITLTFADSFADNISLQSGDALPGGMTFTLPAGVTRGLIYANSGSNELHIGLSGANVAGEYRIQIAKGTFNFENATFGEGVNAAVDQTWTLTAATTFRVDTRSNVSDETSDNEFTAGGSLKKLASFKVTAPEGKTFASVTNPVNVTVNDEEVSASVAIVGADAVFTFPAAYAAEGSVSVSVPAGAITTADALTSKAFTANFTIQPYDYFEITVDPATQSSHTGRLNTIVVTLPAGKTAATVGEAITLNGNSVNVSNVIAGNTVTLTLAEDFPYTTYNYYSIPAGFIVDAEGNKNSAIYPYNITVVKQMMYASAYVNGETTTTNSVTVEKFSSVEIYFDEESEYSYGVPAGVTLMKGEDPITITNGWNSAYNSSTNKYGSYYFTLNEISAPGTYTIHIPAGVFTSVEGNKNEEVNLEIVIPTPDYFAAMTVTPATGTTVQSLKTFTLTAPEGVTFDKVKGLQNYGRVTFDDYAYTNTNNVVWAEDNKSVSFDISEVTTDGEHTLVIPAGFLRSTDGEWSPELTATYTVSYPWFTLRSNNVTPAIGEVADINGITIAAPDGVEFADPAANVPIVVNGVDTQVAASLVEGKIVLDYSATAANRYEISIPAETFTASDGFKKNKELTGITYTIQPTLAINENAVDSEGDHWTSFCLNKSFTLADGYTPYIVCEKAEGGIKLEELLGTPKTETFKVYFNTNEDDAAYLATLNGGTVNSSIVEGKYEITYAIAYGNIVDHRNGQYIDVSNTLNSVTFTVRVLEGGVAPDDIKIRYYTPESQDLTTTFTKVSDNEYTATGAGFVGGLIISYATGEYNKPIIPANAGILVKGDASGDIQYTPANGTLADLSGNLLVGCTQTAVWEDADNYIYKLAWNLENYNNGTYTDFGFYWGSNDGHSMQALAGKAYLKLPANSANSNRLLIFGGSDELVTGIDSVAEASDNAPIFNLQGKRVSRENLTSGVYVQNGKKFIVK